MWYLLKAHWIQRGAEEMDLLIQCLPWKNKELSMSPRTLTEEWGTVAHACEAALEEQRVPGARVSQVAWLVSSTQWEKLSQKLRQTVSEEQHPKLTFRLWSYTRTGAHTCEHTHMHTHTKEIQENKQL